MKILLINNDGGGFADHVEIADGTAVAQLFADTIPGRKAGDFLIRVSGSTTPGARVVNSTRSPNIRGPT